MGVPSFYRWMVKKYPKIAAKVVQEKEESIDTSSPNPNGMEFDNLYLDMNGIIHPCFHPDDDPTPPTTYDEVFDRIYEYIDRLFSIVRPRQVLYMAIDGVAPRAKMNQQRSRRFRTAKDNEISEAEEERLRKQFELEGKQVLPKVECEISDSNIITPGTGFMHTLAEKLKMYIHSRIKDDAGWKSIKVILSDANVPGEGEHKIMSFIRQQRSLPDYNPSTRHCLYGLDADLIMLALATHEVHFSILREDVVTLEQQPFTESVPRGWFNDNTVDKNSYRIKFKKPYEFLHVWILREYLELDMNIPDPPENFNFDRERIIDDFIFICFFAGNDFLPHLPTLEIHEGAIDLLMSVYKSQFKSLGGYLVDMQRVGEQVVDSKAGYVKLKRLEKFILAIGAYEERIFKKRSELHERRLKRLLRDNSDAQEEEEKEGVNLEPSTINNSGACSSSPEKLAADRHEDTLKNTKELKEKLKDSLRKKSDLFKNGALGLDKVKLGNAGWKERYYKQKFSADSPGDIESTRKEIVQKYTEGLLWVLLYYFSGVPSWTWYYPFHYGPFTSDLKGLTSVRVKFLKGSPFKPLDQLLSVLPPRSVHALPKAYRALMTDQNSRIVDFYPTDFEVDTDGKRFWWQGICKLPFIDEDRLVAETRKLEKDLMEDEKVRNAEKLDQLFVGRSSKLGLQIMLPNTKLKFARQNEMMKIDFSLSGEFCGTIYRGDETFCEIHSTSPQHVEDVIKKDDALKKDDVLCVLFELLNGTPHIPRPPEGVLFPAKTITESDIEETVLWHDYQGPRPIVRPQMQERFRDSREKSSSNSSHEVTYKSAGTGWSAGRGKGNAGIIYLARNSPSDAERVIVGIEDCKLSESGQIFRSYGDVQSVNNSARPSRNGFINNRNYESPHFLQSNASPSARPWQNQRGPRSNIVSSGQHGTQFAANLSTQAGGRGHHCPQSWQPGVRPSGEHWQTQRGSTSYTSSSWQHNSQSTSNSWNQAQGRGHWQQNLQATARPFGQPRQTQWGSSTGNPDSTTQHSTQVTTNFSAQADWRGHRPQSLHYTPRPSAQPWQQHRAQFDVNSSTQANWRGHFSQNLQSGPRPTGQPWQRQEGSIRTESTSQPSDNSWTEVHGRRRSVPATSVTRWNSKDSTPTTDTGSRSLR